jgi:hypothetical protein
VPEHDYTLTGGGHTAHGMKPDDPALPKTGYGGHPVNARPKKKALTIYQGRQPFTFDVPMVLWNDGASVEDDRIALENMATTEGERVTQAPPVVQLRASYPLPIPPALGTDRTARWWIEDLEWGKEFRNPPSEGGAMTYKEVTVVLLEWTPDVLLDQHTLTNAKRIGKYRVKKPPDTLKRIASKFHTTVAVIKKLNPKLRSDGSLKDGMTISVPEPAKKNTRRKKPKPKKKGH